MRTKYIKDGNPDWSTYFNSETYDTMTPEQKKHWSPVSASDLEDIPDEVLNFMPIESVLPPLPEEKKDPVPPVTDAPKDLTPPKLTEEEEVIQIRAKLKELGIKFAYNAKIENLRKKLSDANNSK